MTPQKLLQPVFLIGMPRSGTTIVYEALIQHEALAWPPHYLTLMPGCPEICFLNRFFSQSGAKQQRQKFSVLNKLRPRPDEMYPMWQRLLGDKFLFSFLRDTRPTEKEIDRVRAYFNRLIRAEGKKYLAIKLTGPPRMRFLLDIFPDAVFVEIVRDPRAVVASLLDIEFWRRGTRLDSPFWSDALTDEELANCRNESRQSAALAAYQLLAVRRQTDRERLDTLDQFSTIKYEQFVDRPKETMDVVLDLAGLPRSAKLDSYVATRNYRNMNDRYKRNLTTSDIETVERICESVFSEHNYQKSE